MARDGSWRRRPNNNALDGRRLDLCRGRPGGNWNSGGSINIKSLTVFVWANHWRAIIGSETRSFISGKHPPGQAAHLCATTGAQLFSPLAGARPTGGVAVLDSNTCGL